jgi:hypothetical protein
MLNPVSEEESKEQMGAARTPATSSVSSSGKTFPAGIPRNSRDFVFPDGVRNFIFPAEINILIFSVEK